MIAIKDMPMPRNCYECWFEDANRCYLNIIPHIESLDRPEWCPLVEAEPTFEQIEEYCRKRCLIVVDGALFNEMKSRWNVEPIKHGRWIYNGRFCELNHYKCSVCGKDEFRMSDYCPNCGARMDLDEVGE